MPASAFDGSQDTTFEYNCGGATCGNATLIAVIIDTSDGSPPDGAAPKPFEYPPPTQESGRVLCIDLFPAHTSSYTIKKELLKVLPQSWKHARVTIATANSGKGFSPNGTSGGLFAGDGVFGVTHR
jgi:hypothetical protein